ncbi:hypothetical protein L3X38_040544 [Prunus dulcis]|uniref:Uncharacterized protein n=1 Tax=Prunus dulcis TaxID=3755 RepID=A0AAD4VBG9_PRUDU|nr:hypothetical protein L3X38_040544 [Prunus dulcis]
MVVERGYRKVIFESDSLQIVSAFCWLRFLSPSPSRYLLQTLTSRRKTLNLNHLPANSSVSGDASQPLPWPFDSNSQRDQQNLIYCRERYLLFKQQVLFH